MKKIFKEVVYVLVISAFISATVVYSYFFIRGCIYSGRIEFRLIEEILKKKEARNLIVLYTVYFSGISFLYKFIIIKRLKFDDELFTQMDNNIASIGKKNMYIGGIQVIDRFYRDEGYIKPIIDKMNLDLLHRRRKYLKKMLDIENDYVASLIGILVSLSVFILTSDLYNFLVGFIAIVTYMAMALGAVFFRSTISNRFNSKSVLYEYEMKKLESTIDRIYRKMELGIADYRYIDLRSHLLDLLFQARKSVPFLKRKQRQSIDKDIETVRNMYMVRDSYDNLNNTRLELIDGTEINLIVDAKWKATEDLSNHLVDEYKDVYSLLKKYNWLKEQ